MPIGAINDARIYWEQLGDSGSPLVLVHGSWGDHHNWDVVAPALARRFRVFPYDRRGHKQRETPAAAGKHEKDVGSLGGVLPRERLAPVHVAGNSFGAAI